jgi:hypothetical protein
MSDFSLTTLFVVPVGNVLPTTGSPTQNLTAGKFGIFLPNYGAATAATIDDAGVKYFYVAQGRTNTYLQGSKRSDKIAGALQNGGSNRTNVTEWYKTVGTTTANVQITEIDAWNVKPGDIVTVTLRAHSSYIDTLYFNGFTRSVTVQAACLECGGDPCENVDVELLIADIIAAFEAQAPGTNPDNISFNTFFAFTTTGTGATAKLVITGKPLTVYGQPCDVAAFPWEYDRMYFRSFVYTGPATTADFIVDDACNIVAESTVTQIASYPSGTSKEVEQLEKNYYSYQAGYLKHLYRMNGYNENFETWVAGGIAYTLYYIKFNQYDESTYQWGDYIHEDSMVIIAIPNGETAATEAILVAALGTPTTI